jgi:hypothetical protein
LTEAKEWFQKREPDLSTSDKSYIHASAKTRNSQLTKYAIVASVLVISLTAFGIYLSSKFKNGGETNTNNQVASPSPSDEVDDSDSKIAQEDDSLKEATLSPRIEDVTLPSGVIVIPVVVHVVYQTDAENISDEQIKSQIDVLNKDFRARNDDIGKVPAPFRDAIGDARIEFALATTDPHGKTTSGITRTKTSQRSFSAGRDNIYFSHQGGADAWPTESYLNIWVCKLGAGMLGYAMFPGAPKQMDGVVQNYLTFGTTGTVKVPYNLGRQATHDIGHYLNLRHIWGDATDCEGSDFVQDTPPQQGPNSGKPSFPHVTCGNGPNGDMFMNFMDYTDDDHKYMFTKGQVLRMYQTLQGARKGLGVHRP